jgi:hypothetical protein
MKEAERMRELLERKDVLINRMDIAENEKDWEKYQSMLSELITIFEKLDEREGKEEIQIFCYECQELAHIPIDEEECPYCGTTDIMEVEEEEEEEE